MIEVQIAGAGAGKTYGLAEKVSARFQTLEIPKKIFALTYTNAAKSKIESELLKQMGVWPENIYIETVHSFFLNEIIFPFSGYVLGNVYKKASILHLGHKVKFKAWKIKSLKDNGEIHVEKTYSIAKQILDKENSKNKTKAKKARIDKAIVLLNRCIDSIFVDEVQDLDCDALKAFEILGIHNILVYMIGDPKQAIKWPQDFNDFIEKHNCEKSDCFRFLKVNNLTRRVPNEILIHSNRFCYEGQQQKSLSEVIGSVSYIESTDDEFDHILQMHINSDSIVCIDKKKEKYLTGNSYKYCFPGSVEEKIVKAEPRKDEKLIVKAAFNEFMNDAHKHQKRAVSRFINRFGMNLEKSEYAQMYELCETVQKNRTQLNVSSIDAVKGLEADCCLLILTPNTYKYFIQKDIDQKKRFNKEWKKLYVALTRSMRDLILVVDHSLFKNENLITIINSIEELGVKRYSEI